MSPRRVTVQCGQHAVCATVGWVGSGVPKAHCWELPGCISHGASRGRRGRRRCHTALRLLLLGLVFPLPCLGGQGRPMSLSSMSLPPPPKTLCLDVGRVVCAEVWGDLSCGLSAKGMACISVGGPTAELALIPSCAAGRSGVGPVGPGKGGGVGAAEAGAPLGPEPPVQSDRDTVQGQHRPVRLGKMLPTPLAGQAAGECCVFACFPLFLFLSLVFPACSLCVRRGWRLTLQPRR